METHPEIVVLPISGIGGGEDVDASEYVVRTSTPIETAAAAPGCLSSGVFVTVKGRRPGGVVDETHRVG